jgi:DNA modification methylase
MKYEDFLKSKALKVVECGFKSELDIGPLLFDFQRDIVKWALTKGKAAIFSGCGTGKTPMQLEWAKHVCYQTGGNVLIVAPLAVADQTVEEGKKFHVEVTIIAEQSDIRPGVNITNYEKLHKIDVSEFVGVVLDESSILKSYDGKTRTAIINAFVDTPYKLACTATPSPNDYAELGNHAEFFGIMKRTEMLANFFVHDSKPGQHHPDQKCGEEKWRLKGHAVKAFWQWVASWAVMMQKPSDLRYEDNGFVLPELRFHQVTVKSTSPYAKTIQERQKVRGANIDQKVAALKEIVDDNIWLIWCGLNKESEALTKALNAVEVKGSDDPEKKKNNLMAFCAGDIKRMVSKCSIAGFGLNMQVCNKVAFVGLSDSFEEMYQAVRRCWRFGQKEPVDVYVLTSEAEGAVVKNIEKKEKKFGEMLMGMISATQEICAENLKATRTEEDTYKPETKEGKNWKMYLGDCVTEMRKLESESIHYMIYSPPFKNIFVYSNSNKDLGNSRNMEEFQVHMKYVADELYRLLRPGRLMSFHCADIPAFKYKDGFAGLQDLPGALIATFVEAGFHYHSRVTIYKSPVTEMYRTKTQGLLYKQLKQDSAISRQGLADYVVTMRKPGDNLEPIVHAEGSEHEIPLPAWQKYADPVWMDILQTDTLNNKSVREYEDEKHICPLQLGLIDRCLELWTNEGDTVLSPFAGIGSEGYTAVRKHRNFIGFELKKSYFDQACDYLNQANKEGDLPRQVDLFKFADEPITAKQMDLFKFEKVD